MSQPNFILIAIILSFFANYSNVFAASKNSSVSLPAVLKADRIDGDQENEVINAVGNVELKKDGNVLLADEVLYDEKNQDIEAFGDIRIKNYDIGNVRAKTAKVKSDFSSGSFTDATIVFNDGSYIKSPEVLRHTISKTVFNRSIFSLCPNGEIEKNNKLAGKKRDLFSIKSKTTTINKEKNSLKTNHSLVRLYDVPFFYTPYFKMPLPASKRQSGFLTPSYINTSKLGAGIALPYYSNIAPNKDLITTIQYHPSGGHALLDNKYRHLLENGQYEVDLEIANNRPKTNNLIGTANREINKEFRFYGKASGNFSFSEETALDFNIDHVGDKNYLRDYQNGFVGHKVSTINLDYIKNQDYASIKLVETQELEIDRDETTAPMALPIINYVKTIKPKNSSLNETYKLLFNSTFITRENGLQYRRLSTKPEIRVPYNLNGNLFEIGANIQGDFYNMENNSKHSQPDNNFKSTAFNYRPEADLKWSLPMVGKYKTNTIIIEPLARITIGTFKNNSDEIPNEDSQDIELTQSNLFLSDRFTGFDRNESGTRASYGFKSSLFNDVIGKFNFALGQSWRENSKTQDVVIRGFDEKKSNIVGEFGYDFFNNFSLRYNFHLNESSYRNDVNDFSANLNLGRLSLNGDYIFISKTDSTLEARKQIRAGARFNVTDKFSLNFENTQDLVNSRTITRRYGLLYDGCCVSYSFVVAEDNPIISSKAQKSFSINFVIKNL